MQTEKLGHVSITELLLYNEKKVRKHESPRPIVNYFPKKGIRSKQKKLKSQTCVAIDKFSDDQTIHLHRGEVEQQLGSFLTMCLTMYTVLT